MREGDGKIPFNTCLNCRLIKFNISGLAD